MADTLQRTTSNKLESGGLEATKLFPTNLQGMILSYTEKEHAQKNG